MPWKPGDVIVRREILTGRPWLGTTVFVVADEPDLLASYLPGGAPFGFPAGDWPAPNSRHPWHGRGVWEGWDPEWTRWEPPATWWPTPLPEGWDVV